MNTKELKQQRIRLFRDAAAFKKTERIPYLSAAVTWKILDAGYKISEAMTDFAVMERCVRHFLDKYPVDAVMDLGIRNQFNVTEAFGPGGYYYYTDETVGIHDHAHCTVDTLEDYLDDPVKYIWERILPEKYGERVSRMFRGASGAVFSYIRAYLLIMTVTFFELLIGLTAVGVSGALVASLAITLIDVLPVLGCGAVLVPWAVWSFVSGEAGRGIGMLVVFGVIYVVRQFLEPRLIGKMTGVHPFAVLAGMYIGLKLCGVGGMIGVPVALMCVMAGKEKT